VLPDPREKPWLTVDEAVATPGWPLGRTQTYAAVKAGAIRSLRLGSRLAIPTVELWRLAGLDANDGASARGPADTAIPIALTKDGAQYVTPTVSNGRA
jgi:hypothetical protein